MAFNYSPKIVTDGLVLYLDAANPNSYVSGSTTWRDISRGGNNGTLTNGPTFNSSNGGSIVFDGSNDYVDLGNILNFERTDKFSISAWVNASSLSSFGMILCKMDTNQKGYFLDWETTGAITFSLRNTANTNDFLTTTVGIISINNWVNVCVTYNGGSSATGVTFYLNSIQQSKTISRDVLSSSIVNTYSNIIGARVSFNNGYVNGKISQLTVYNRELSYQEILQNYNATKSRFGLT
jgi:hypothetical protein